MCRQVVESVQNGDSHVVDDVRRIVGDPAYVPNDPRELCNRLFITCYMGTVNSSAETRQRAEALSSQIGRLYCTSIFASFLIFIKYLLNLFYSTAVIT